jgi:hypothetical protein
LQAFPAVPFPSKLEQLEKEDQRGGYDVSSPLEKESRGVPWFKMLRLCWKRNLGKGKKTFN